MDKGNVLMKESSLQLSPTVGLSLGGKTSGKLLLRASVAAAIANLLPSASFADEASFYRPIDGGYACVNPRATRALMNKDDMRRNDPNWVNYVVNDGRCLEIDPKERWELVSKADGLFLLRLSPPKIGIPPLFFMPSQVMPDVIHGGGAPALIKTDDDQSKSNKQGVKSEHDSSNILPKGWEKPNLTSPQPDTNKGATTPSSEKPTSLAQVNEPIAAATRKNDDGSGMFWLILIGCGIVGWLWLKHKRRQNAENRRVSRLNSAWNLVNSEIIAQSNQLQVKRFQLATPDHYGTINMSKWSKEVEYFCTTRLRTILIGSGLDDQWLYIEGDALAAIEYISAEVPQGATLNTGYMSDPRVFDIRMNPIDYEKHCALLLGQAGWDARVTQASGDQGADVIATRNGKKIVVQCKLYSQPVGNKAVQEVYTACQHQRADAALVVSNAGYTLQARQLANTTGVYLLHHQELGSF